MIQPILPWTPSTPEARAALRRKAIGVLAGLGIVNLVVAAAVYLVLRKSPGLARTLLLLMVVAGPASAALPLMIWGVLKSNPLWTYVGGALGGVAALVAALLFLTPIDPFALAIIALVIGPGLGGVSFLTGTLAIIAFRQIAALLQTGYVALTIFLGGVVGIVLVTWLHAVLFRFVTGVAGDATINGPVRTFFGGELTIAELTIAAPARLVPLAYILWPLQFSFVRDLLAMGGIIGFINLIPLYGIWWERKVAGRIQSRLGPMRVGGWHGWAQSLADGLKLICKEDFIPPSGDRPLFRLAPYLAFVPVVCAFIAFPFAGSYVFRNLDVALLFILAMIGIEVVGVIVAGWASNNKWSVYGSMREACQMVSYEIPMGMSLLIPVMLAGALRLSEVADIQRGGFVDWLAWRNPLSFIAFLTYYIASLASCKRAPFDLPESESELVAGFHTEYSGFRWSLFFFAEYAAMYVVAGLAAILFLGAWYGPFPMSWAPTGNDVSSLVIRGLLFDGPILLVLKAGFLFYVQIWIRWTLPRIRIDQVLYSCIQVMLPLTMLVLLGNTIWILFDDPSHPIFYKLARTIQYALATFGVLVVLVMISLVLYGWRNKRRLVGTLAIEHLPGS